MVFTLVLTARGEKVGLARGARTTGTARAQCRLAMTCVSCAEASTGSTWKLTPSSCVLRRRSYFEAQPRLIGRCHVEAGALFQQPTLA